MGLKGVPKFSSEDVKKLVLQRAGLIEDAIISRLQFVGETFIATARSIDTYKDRTANLRSSIGYIILKDGIQIFSEFPGEKPVGQAKGAEVAEQVSQRFPTGLVLICVAGMEYAGYVEGKGYDVITGSALQAEVLITSLMKELSEKLGL